MVIMDMDQYTLTFMESVRLSLRLIVHLCIAPAAMAVVTTALLFLDIVATLVLDMPILDILDILTTIENVRLGLSLMLSLRLILPFCIAPMAMALDIMAMVWDIMAMLVSDIMDMLVLAITDMLV